eukprot:gene7506-10011_t
MVLQFVTFNTAAQGRARPRRFSPRDRSLFSPYNPSLFIFCVLLQAHLVPLVAPVTPELRRDKTPKFLVQYGPPRTATTLQFQILCAVAVLLRTDPARETVHCDYKLSRATLKMFFLTNRRTRIVAKEHSVDRALEHLQQAAKEGTTFGNDDGGAWLFTTSGRNDSASSSVSKALLVSADGARSVDVKYEQNYNRVLELGSRIAAADYAPLFGLTVRETAVLEAYIHDWDVLRLCCGTQLSKGYRSVLWNAGSVRGGGAADTETGAEPAAPVVPAPLPQQRHACENYNIPAVEMNLVNSDIFKRGRDVPRLLQASLRDGPFTGKYCKCANQMISEKKLAFNVPMRNNAADCTTI